MKIEIGEETTAVIIKTLYEQSRNIHPQLIPDIVYLNIAQELQKYEEEIGYFDRWVIEKLEIAPMEAFSSIRITDCRDNGFYCETESGNMTILGMGDL